MGHKEFERIIHPKFFSHILSAMRVINSDKEQTSTYTEAGLPNRLCPSRKFVANSTKTKKPFKLPVIA